MKNVLMFSILLLGSFHQRSVAQNTMGFAPPTAEWWHNIESVVSLESLVYSFVKGDTLIDGVLSRKVGQILYNKDHFARKIDTVLLHDLFVYDTGDTVYVYNDNFNKFTPLYIFNAGEGDTVCIPVISDREGRSDLRPNPFANGDTSFCFVIDSIRMVLYDTVYLATVFQHSIIDESYSFPVYNWHPHASGWLIPTGAYTRRTGGLFGGLLPVLNEPVVMRPTDESYVYNGLRCYKDDSVSISILYDEEGCFFDPIPVKVNQLGVGMKIRSFPNPSNGTVTLEGDRPFPTDMRLFITDISGRIVRYLESPANKSSGSYMLNDLSPGIYLLVITIGEERYFKKIVLSER